MAPSTTDEPITTITINNAQVSLLGTAHVSRTSAETVTRLLQSGEFDAVAVELCPSRHNAIVNPDSLAKMDLFQVIREGKISLVAASLALGAFQQRIAEQLDIEPGAEMKAAISCARNAHLPILLIDREVSTTLKRIYRHVPWWQRLTLLSGIVASLFSRQQVSEEEIERLKEGDILESTFTQFAEQAHELYEPLINERDRYMAARLQHELRGSSFNKILVVIGAGHMKGTAEYLENPFASPQEEITRLDQLPPPRRWPKLIPWLIVAIILVGFTLGFQRSTTLGWQLVGDWVLINGGLCALGALLAAAHPVTVITAFLAAPLTSLNPAIGAGMVTAAMETLLRKPDVGDFMNLRTETAQLRGWWSNRVARVLLVFLFSTVGSAIGTYLAGFKIFGRLVS
jgi:pheromone shutdown-related protein TraB